MAFVLLWERLCTSIGHSVQPRRAFEFDPGASAKLPVRGLYVYSLLETWQRERSVHV